MTASALALRAHLVLFGVALFTVFGLGFLYVLVANLYAPVALYLAIAPAQAQRADGVRWAHLVSLDWAVYARAAHPARRAWSAQAWAAWPHVRVRTASGRESPVDAVARARRLTRRAGPTLPHFMLAPPLLARTNLLMTVPRAVLADVAPRCGLVALHCPPSSWGSSGAPSAIKTPP